MRIVHPLRDQILVRFESAPDKIGSIHVPDAAKEKPMQAEVIAVGPGRLLESGQRVEPSVKRGDRVLVAKYTGHEVTIDGEKLHVVNERDVLGIVD